MVEVFEIDLQGSIELQKKYPIYAVPKKCYENVYHIATHIDAFREQRPNEKYIAIGYVKTSGLPIANRHAFFVIGNKVLDPTLVYDKAKYYVAERLSLSEYCDRILKSKYYDMHNDLELIDKERNLMRELKDMEIYCCG